VKVKGRRKRDLADQVFSTKDFVRTLSYREFVTSLSLALLLLAIYTLINYYSNEDWIGNNETALRWTAFSMILLLNHIFYKVEHKRSNNFIGRNFHDHIFLLLFVSLYKLRRLLYGSGLSLDVEGIGDAIVSVLLFIIFVMFFELAVAMLKRGLKLVRWQIL
jgi:hypothetical protein